jgi:hypothetical protein
MEWKELGVWKTSKTVLSVFSFGGLSSGFFGGLSGASFGFTSKRSTKTDVLPRFVVIFNTNGSKA